MKKVFKLFFSLPFKGQTDEYVEREIKKMYIKFLYSHREELYDSDTEELKYEFKFVSNWDYSAPADSKNSRANQIGEAIKRMSDCDLVLFHPNWKFAKGCEVEHLMCEIYKIPYVNLERD